MNPLRGLSCLFQVYSIISLINLVYGNIRILTVLSKQSHIIGKMTQEKYRRGSAISTSSAMSNSFQLHGL